MRLVIAVDEITTELKQIVTFLNRQTTTKLELLAIELRRAVDHGVEVLIPQTYGEESAAQNTRSRQRVNEASVLVTLRSQHAGAPGERMVALYEFLRDRGARLSWGSSTSSPSVTAWLGEEVGNPVSIGFYPEGVAVNFHFVAERRSPPEMQRLAELIRAVPGARSHCERLEQSGYRMRPTMPPEQVLATDAALDAFQRAIIEAAAPQVG
jgi:hypothetical protein